MRHKFLWKPLFILIVFFFTNPWLSFSAEVLEKIDSQQRIPSLMESIQFKDDIHYCGIKIPLHRQDVKQRLEKELLLALWDRPQVILWIKRASKYFLHVETILKKQGLPLDLRFVPVVESALKPHAKSSKNAVGYWQFLKSTGKEHGLRIDSMIDERRNIFKSTTAAGKYLKDLENQFGSYLLALAAYNMGEYRLKKEIRDQKTQDFFSLYLPLQTQGYVFKVICAKLILENQEFYGFSLKPSDLYPVFTFDKVNLSSDFQIPITLIATAADISFKKIKDFNPELRGYYLDRGEHAILIPKGKAKGFEEHFTTAVKKWEKTIKNRFHVVKSGESLTGISKKYRISLSSLLKLNNLSLKGMIHPGDRLMIK